MNLNNILETEKQKKREFTSAAMNSVMLCMFACALMLVLQIVISNLPLPSGTEISDAISTIIIYCTFMIVPTFLLSYCFERFFKKFNTEIPKSNNLKNPILYITGTLGIGYLTNLLVNILFSEFVEKHTVDSGTAPRTIAGIILIYITNAVLPAILEEWAFRGVICKNLIPYNKTGAIIISALLFGFMHINPSTIIFTTVIGALLAVCYVYTGSLKIPMLIHFLNNALATTITIFMDADNPEDPVVLITFFIMIILMILGISAIIHYTRHGLSKKRISLKMPDSIGYKLSIGNFLTVSVINVGIIPLIILYVFFYNLIYKF